MPRTSPLACPPRRVATPSSDADRGATRRVAAELTGIAVLLSRRPRPVRPTTEAGASGVATRACHAPCAVARREDLVPSAVRTRQPFPESAHGGRGILFGVSSRRTRAVPGCRARSGASVPGGGRTPRQGRPPARPSRPLARTLPRGGRRPRGRRGRARDVGPRPSCHPHGDRADVEEATHCATLRATILAPLSLAPSRGCHCGATCSLGRRCAHCPSMLPRHFGWIPNVGTS